MDKVIFEHILTVALALAAASLLSFIFRRLMNIYIKRYAQKLRTDPTNFSFLKNSVGFIAFTCAVAIIFVKIPFLSSFGATLFKGAGLLAVVVGFASQKAFSNIISGIFILVFKPFKIADIIEFKDGQKGMVEEITLRHTIIKDYENRRIIIPNSIISDETIINSNIQDEKIRKHVVFSISYDSNIDRAIEIIRDEAEKHPLLVDNRTEEEKQEHVPVVTIRVIALNDFSVDIKAYVWSQGNDNAFTIYCDLLKSVKDRFDREGIEIPYPHRTIVYKKDISHAPKLTEKEAN